jgi:hypothetical protein
MVLLLGACAPAEQEWDSGFGAVDASPKGELLFECPSDDNPLSWTGFGEVAVGGLFGVPQDQATAAAEALALSDCMDQVPEASCAKGCEPVYDLPECEILYSSLITTVELVWGPLPTSCADCHPDYGFTPVKVVTGAFAWAGGTGAVSCVAD